MKKLLAIILAILTMFTFTACSSDSDNTIPPTEPEQETAVCYEFSRYVLYSGNTYRWGDKYNGIVFTEKYAKFILKNDGTCEIWWKNVLYNGVWKNVSGDLKIVYDKDTQSLTVRTTTDQYHDTLYYTNVGNDRVFFSRKIINI